MQEILAHAGHSHGPDPALIALLVAVTVLAVAATTAVVQRHRARRNADRS